MEHLMNLICNLHRSLIKITYLIAFPALFLGKKEKKEEKNWGLKRLEKDDSKNHGDFNLISN